MRYRAPGRIRREVFLYQNRVGATCETSVVQLSVIPTLTLLGVTLSLLYRT